MPEKDFVGMALCFYCQKPSSVLIHRQLKKVMECGVYNMEPCHECHEWMKQGVIVISATQKSLEKMESERQLCLKNRQPFIPNPYRTGGWWVIKDDAIRRFLIDEDMLKHTLQQRWIFITHETAEHLGLFSQVETEEGNEDNEVAKIGEDRNQPS